MPSDGQKKNLLDLIRTYKTKKILQKPAEMEQQLKQQLMQKKNLCKSLAKKKESTVFSILPFAKIVPTIKKNTIHHHIKKSHTHFKMISNHQRTVLKLFMKKRKVYAQINKKNIDEIPPIHINFYLKSSSLICQSYISISLLF